MTLGRYCLDWRVEFELAGFRPECGVFANGGKVHELGVRDSDGNLLCFQQASGNPGRRPATTFLEEGNSSPLLPPASRYRAD